MVTDIVAISEIDSVNINDIITSVNVEKELHTIQYVKEPYQYPYK